MNGYDWKRCRTLLGIDSLQALSLAINFIGQSFKDLNSKGWKYYYTRVNEENEIEWGAYFQFPEFFEKLKGKV